MTEINVPLLRKTLEYITEHPDEWRQSYWATKTPCRTAYCFAGWAAVLAGHEIDFDDCNLLHGDGKVEAALTVEGKSISEVAEEELGIDPNDADMLFDGFNSLEEITRYVSDIIETGTICKPIVDDYDDSCDCTGLLYEWYSNDPWRVS